MSAENWLLWSIAKKISVLKGIDSWKIDLNIIHALLRSSEKQQICISAGIFWYLNPGSYKKIIVFIEHGQQDSALTGKIYWIIGSSKQIKQMEDKGQQ